MKHVSYLSIKLDDTKKNEGIQKKRDRDTKKNKARHQKEQGCAEKRDTSLWPVAYGSQAFIATLLFDPIMFVLPTISVKHHSSSVHVT